MSTICYEIDKDSKAMLMEKFPPKYPKEKYDHITICIGGLGAPLPEPAEKIEVVGIADDGNGIEALIVRVNDSATHVVKERIGKEKVDKIRFWHITASLDCSKNAPAEFDVLAEPGKEKEQPYKPVMSNGLLERVLDENGNPKTPANPKWTAKMFDKPISIKTHPKVQYNEMELSKMKEKGMSL